MLENACTCNYSTVIMVIVHFSSLSGNNVGDDGMKAICAEDSYFPKLEKLK